MKVINQYLNKHIFYEIAPIVIFFIASKVWGITPAIYAIIVSTILFSAFEFYKHRKIPVLPFITLILVASLGGATIAFENEVFIKIKTSIGFGVFGLILFISQIFGKSVLKRALEGQIYLSEEGWSLLTNNWSGLSLLFAIMNECVWRTQSTELWVTFTTFLSFFSIFGFMFLTKSIASKYWLEPK
ncbi:inner membrane-spanning protein YciB [Vibrio sp. 10N.222.54.B12]|uniref:inner membrane-spanning protein YciB n=1 Tax=Vibrio sp. 10N.222.54.B12 TaxID=3229636 RepID=UPI00354FA576